MDTKLSRKRLRVLLLLLTAAYIIIQSLVLFFDDLHLSRKFWIEHKGLKELQESGIPLRSKFTPITKNISNHHFWLLRAGLVVSVALSFYYRKRDKRKYLLFKSISVSVIISLALISGLLTWALKLGIGKPRPYTGLSEYMPFSLSTRFHSFPSGHTTETFSYIIPFVYFLRRYYCAVLLSLYGLAVAFTRVILAYHSFTDVLFGIYAALIISLVICYRVEGRYDNYVRDSS